MLKDNREVGSQYSSSFSSSSESSSSDKGGKLSPIEGDLLMIRLMIGHIKNILKKLKETCTLIIDGGSCTNLVS